MGAVGFTSIAPTGPLVANEWHENDITDAVTGPGKTLNLGIATEADQINLRSPSRETGAFAPELLIQYQP